MSYEVNLDVYDGPLELLLELVTCNDLDICDVSLAQITNDYLQYVSEHSMATDELQAFLSVAAQLIAIKARALSGSLEEADEPSDSDLAEKLRQYQQVRHSASLLTQLWQSAKPRYSTVHEPITGDYSHLLTRFNQAIQRLSDNQAQREQFELRFARNRPELAQHRQAFAQAMKSHDIIQLNSLLSDCRDQAQGIVYFLCLLNSLRQGECIISIHGSELCLQRASI